MAGSLASVRDDLAKVQKALSSGGTYLGFSGQDLSKLNDTLIEKQSILVEIQKRSSSNGWSSSASASRASFAGLRPAPPGPAVTFDRCSLADVLSHMCDYEAVPQECVKALRALASLAYKDPADVAFDDRVMGQILRLLCWHAQEPAVLHGAMKVMSHLAFEQDIALGTLARRDVLAALISVRRSGGEGNGNATTNSAHAEATKLAGEAIARILAAAQTEAVAAPDGSSKGNTEKATHAVKAILTAEAAAEFEALKNGAWQRHSQNGIQELLARLVEQELVEQSLLVSSFVGAAPILDGKSTEVAAAAAGWLALLRQLVPEGAPGRASAELFVKGGCMPTITSLMEMHPRDALVQGQGIAAYQLLTSSCKKLGPEAFSETQGVQRAEWALATLPEDESLQRFGILLLVSVLDWPMPVQKKCSLDFRKAVAFTKEAMRRHLDSALLQVDALQSLAKFIEVLACIDQVKEGGAEGLIKAVMTRHTSNQELKTWGRIVLDAMGVDRLWEPKGSS
eukprot:TRINITY_DN30571_c0_g2_i1.p1 TRINITY_DN30571_c0_g2~~TRINITY_DN30571_c0_g2_i1.p1  ORF type:complete len:511 (+),score=126.91 TRINITY_DN30571_c0_g2_i1:47-1579(+)